MPITLNSAQFNGARAFGPALGGVVLATLGPGLVVPAERLLVRRGDRAPCS